MYRAEVLYYIVGFKIFYLNLGCPTYEQQQKYLKDTKTPRDNFFWDRIKLSGLSDKELLELYVLLINNYYNYRTKSDYLGVFN